jgi:hypothetical protein
MSDVHLLTRVSITGVDESTSIEDLKSIAWRYPFVEWAALYTPHRMGVGRNPSKSWLYAFFSIPMAGFKAIHLCGKMAFDQLLSGTYPDFVAKADRIQLNVNARKVDFTDEEVILIYHTALGIGKDIILQYHPDSAPVIEMFLQTVAPEDKHRVHILLDASRGLGVTPISWAPPEHLKQYYFGNAGGIGPDNIWAVLFATKLHTSNHWIDGESHFRTDNKFDQLKAERVLHAVSESYQDTPRLKLSDGVNNV